MTRLLERHPRAPRRGGRITAIPLALLLATSACTGEPAADPADSVAASATADTVPSGPTTEAWTATPAGVGPVRAGMTAEEIATATGSTFAAPDTSCVHVPLMGAAESVLAMMVDGRLARVEVKDGVVATDRGARVGDSEARIDTLYAGRVTVEPHKYTDGHYLVVAPAAAADSAFRLIFETDGQRVLEYRVGLLPMVAWVEGCS